MYTGTQYPSRSQPAKLRCKKILGIKPEIGKNYKKYKFYRIYHGTNWLLIYFIISLR